MSVATQTLEHACHMPCPDLGCYSLDAEQKAVGLAGLQKTRAYLKELQLEQLRKEHKKLTAEANHEDTTQQRRTRISQELSKISSKAQRITERWS